MTTAALSPSESLFFLGDFVHAAAGQPHLTDSEGAFRLHAYVDPVSFVKKDNSTNILAAGACACIRAEGLKTS